MKCDRMSRVADGGIMLQDARCQASGEARGLRLASAT